VEDLERIGHRGKPLEPPCLSEQEDYMKKQKKTLKLAKDTVAILNGVDLVQIEGGGLVSGLVCKSIGSCGHECTQ
jgi:hypothetical protein